jgi:CBS domain-containing protein
MPRATTFLTRVTPSAVNLDHLGTGPAFIDCEPQNKEPQMDLLVKEIMKRNVQTVAPQVTLPELEEAFLKQRVSGFPVVDKGELVGIVSRTDIVRQLFLEHQTAERTSDFFFDDASGFHEIPLDTFTKVADRVGERIEKLRVKDVMSRDLVQVSPDQTVRIAAQTMTDRGLHRVLVTEENRLLGLVSSLDLVSLLSNGRFQLDH